MFLRYRTLIFTLCQLAIDTVAIDLSAWQTFVSFLINVFSFLLSCFRFFELSPRNFPWSMFTYDLMELNLILNVLGLTELIIGEASQIVVSI